MANLVVYLASPKASATTGAAVRVDGGVVNSIAYGNGYAAPRRASMRVSAKWSKRRQ